MDVNFSELPKVRLERMRSAGEEALECYRVLSKAGANVVGELLKGEGKFYEWNHYPDGDIYDNETHSQYYYHAHRGKSTATSIPLFANPGCPMA